MESHIAIISVLASWASVLVTWKFYSALVKNDNAREMRAEEASLKVRLGGLLYGNRSQLGALCQNCNAFAKKYPGKQKLILSAYDDLYYYIIKTDERMGGIVRPDELRNGLRQHDPQIWELETLA